MTFEDLLQLEHISDIEALTDAEIEELLRPILELTKLPEDFNPIAEALGEKEEAAKAEAKAEKAAAKATKPPKAAKLTREDMIKLAMEALKD